MSIENDEIFDENKIIYKFPYVDDSNTKIQQLQDKLSLLQSLPPISIIKLEELKNELNKLEMNRLPKEEKQ